MVNSNLHDEVLASNGQGRSKANSIQGAAMLS